MHFTHAIVCPPCKNFIYGITTASLGKPNYLNALVQHQEYVELLEKMGLDVIVLSADDDYPDSTFVEDTAVLLSRCVIISNPGAESRRGEINSIEQLLKKKFIKIEKVVEPGTLDGGDVLEIGNCFYIGISKRTNQTGADQLIDILSKYKKFGSIIPVNKGLHLKSAVSYLGENHVLIDPESIDSNYFKGFTIIKTESSEGYAANSISVNGTVIMPKGFPKTRDNVEKIGFSIMTIDISEFRKLDGGLSCLSLRY